VGILYQQARMLLDACRAGMPMRNVLMVGHQALLLHPSELRKLQKDSLFPFENYEWGEYADRFFKDCLGAVQVDILDYSSYEGANILHDLSQPISDDLTGRYDVVIEAGTLEHVFNFPIAIANLMKMTRLGGTLFASTVSNNLCGHGFYQFSPELIFRVFTEGNGFKLGKVLAMEARYPGVELSSKRSVYEVADPAALSCRVGLVTKRPVMLFFETQKTADVPIFSKSPMQSDYAAAWFSRAEPAKSKTKHWLKRLPRYVFLRTALLENAAARALRNWMLGRHQLKRFSLKNKQFYRKL
jgi:hypothetical protein